MNNGWFLLISPGIVFTACSGNAPQNIGVHEGRLTPCPDSPNCVSSQSSDEEHFVDPFPYAGSRDAAYQAVISAIQSMKRSRIVSREPNYLRAEFTSAVFRFVDDVEFLFVDDERIVHVRSASRLGYSDLGVNRKRVEALRQLYMKASVSDRE